MEVRQKNLMKQLKHAYLIVAHNNFKIQNKLIEFLDDPDNDFYFLIDKKTEESFENIITYKPKFSHVFEIPRMNVNWGAFSFNIAEFKLLQYAYGKYDYYHLFQGADFPIKQKSEIKQFFQDNYGKEFVRFRKEYYSQGEYKINYHHFFVDNKLYRKSVYVRGISHFICRAERSLKLFRNNDSVYCGSALWSITNNFAKYVIENEEYFVRRCKYTLSADEVIFQTMLMQSPFKNNIFRFEKEDADLRAIDWARRVHNSPHTYTLEDFDFLINQDSCYLFARKFNEEVDFAIIQKLFECLKEDR